MRRFWETKGKRIGAMLLALLLLFGAMPNMDMRMVYAAEPEEGNDADDLNIKNRSTDQSVTVAGKVLKPDGTEYEGAVVTLQYPDDEQAETNTDASGAYTFEIEDWELEENAAYSIQVAPAEGDAGKYEQDADASSYKVSADEVTDSKILVADITLQSMVHTVTYTLSEGGDIELIDKDENTYKGTENAGSNSVEIKYTSPYQIKVAVTENEKYHLTSVKIDDGTGETEQLVQADTDKGNDCNEKIIQFDNGITTDITIIVEAALDSYKVTVESSTGGTVTPVLGAIVDGTIEAVYDSELTFDITPDTGYMVKRIRINGTDVLYTDCTDHKDGSYQYVLGNIKEAKTISVEFGEITTSVQDYADIPLSFTGKDGKTLTLDGQNTCYTKEDVAVSAGSGKKLRLAENDEFKDTVIITEATMLETVYLCEANPSNFGTEEKITLNPQIRFVVDGEAPIINFDETTIWANKTAESVTVEGKVTDENLDKVVCSSSVLTVDEVLATTAEELIVNVSMNGSFAKVLDIAVGDDTADYYLYAVDKAGNFSQKTVTLYRDTAEPQITKAVLDSQIHSYSFGNFYNETLRLILTANDSGNTGCPASGVEKVSVFSDNKNVVEKKMESDTNGTIVVEIPVKEAGGFEKLSELQLTVTDKMGNESSRYALTDFTDIQNAGVTSGKLMLEKNAPDISVEPSENGLYQQRTETETFYWYKTIPTIDYRVTDNDGSGLAAREISLNSVSIDAFKKSDYTDAVQDYSAVCQEESGTLTVDNLTGMAEGKNEVRIGFTDLAGNYSEQVRNICMDTHAPKITGFSIEKKSTLPDKIVNIFTFGNFANDKVIITVSAEDAKDEQGKDIPSSGLKEVTLYLDGVAYQTATVQDGKARFELPASDILVSGKYLDAVVTARAYDNVGNESSVYDMTTGNSNIESSKLMIETVKPDVTIVPGAQGYMGADGTVYNNTETEFTVNVADADAGLHRVIITINDSVLEDNTYAQNAVAATKTDVYTVNTKDAAVTAEGLYRLKVTAIDNAGNETSVETMVYKDETAPEILRFEMQAMGTSDADGTVLSVSEMDYGYYFHEDTRVTVYAIDGEKAGDCGVKEIHYYTVDIEGKKSNVQTIAANEQGAASFVIPAEFKGQIYACAYDWLLNSTETYVTPHSLIIETPEQHNKEEHITYTKKDAPYKDSKGEELYAENVEVNIYVKDTFSGIRKIEWAVEAPYDTKSNQSGKIELDNAGNFISGSNTDGWSKVTQEKNIVTELQKKIVVSNNSNDIVVHVAMTDRAGNVTEKELKFSIDKTNPAIEISFDNENADAENPEMYKESRVATITVTERNFNAADFVATVTNTDGAAPQISAWTTSQNTSDPDATINTATITFSEDGDYTLSMSGHDRAGNLAKSVDAEEFTIDKTKPVITVTYNNANVVNGNYYASEQTATIRIEEHNFSEKRVEITGTVTDNGTGTAFPSASGWSTEGDVHTATIVCANDGLYRFDIAYTDMAGNEAEKFIGEEYYVDMTEPEIEITGVEDMSANNGDVIPKISMTDTNYDTNGVSIELVGANHGTVTPDGAYTAQGNGQIFTFNNFAKEQETDDIYTLTATLTDMAGNESTDTITFSVNRFGSVYVFDDSLKNIAGSYIQNEIDVKLTEVNVDSLEHDRIKVVVDTNGTPHELSEGTDYTVQESGGNGNWYQYDYTIDKSLFAGDGRYIVTLYSEDAAGNINENIAESKEAEISFGIDKTAPVVIPIDIESDAQYAVDTKSATVAVNDNLVLENVEVYIGDAKCEYSVDGENYTFSVPNATSRQDITVAATDAAGNRTNYVISGVLVTTNAFIRWYNNTPLFVGTIAGVAVVSGGGVGLVFALRGGRLKVRRRKISK